MSTFSSQLIVCSSAIIEDAYRVVSKKDVSEKTLVNLSRLAVVGVSLVALYLAFDNNASILSLVGFAWAGFGAAFGPLTIMALYWRKLTTWGAFAGMVTGTITVFLWDFFDTRTGDLWLFNIYELAPAFVVALLAIWIVSRVTYRPHEEISEEFSASVEMVKAGA